MEQTTVDTTAAVNDLAANSGEVAAAGGVSLVISALLLAFVVIVHWRIYAKAGKPGWTCLVPLYNLYILNEIAGKPSWQFLLFLVPVANVYAYFSVSLGVAKTFGRSTAFGFGIALLPFIFLPILAFSEAVPVVGAPAPVEARKVA